MLHLLRWLLIIPAAVGAWYVALFAGIALLIALDGLCPAGQKVSGACGAPWNEIGFNTAMCLGAGLAALLILFACTWLAPTHKRLVAVATFVAGSGVALAMAMSIGNEAWYALAAAICAGMFGLWVVMRRVSRVGVAR